EAVARGKDLRLGFRRQAYAFGVATALEIEDAVRSPAMLVVAKERARRIRRQRRLAGSREPEEDRRVAVRPDIGRAVHGHDTAFRQQVVERREYRLLHLAGIAASADQHDHAGEVDGDDGLGTCTMARRVGAE